MIIAAEMPIRFWPDALNSATRIHNLLPCASRKFQSPNQIETGSVTPAEIMCTHIFGSRCFVHLTPNEKAKASKMKPFAWRGVYLGKAIGKEGHLVWCEQRKAAFVRDSVTFDDGKHWLSHLQRILNDESPEPFSYQSTGIPFTLIATYEAAPESKEK